MRPVRAGAVGLMVFWAGHAAASTRLFLQEVDANGNGVSIYSQVALVRAVARSDGLDISVTPVLASVLPRVRMFFSRQGGGTPTPGLYPFARSAIYHSAADGPVFSVSEPLSDPCSDFDGAFRVDELDAAPDGTVTRLSVSYDRICRGESVRRAGTVGLRTGDHACTGNPDGTPCDDGDLCTVEDNCRSESDACVGHYAPSPACAPEGPCERRAVCDPTDGSCVVAPKPDRTGCDDGSDATAQDQCLGGQCLGCDTSNPCQRFVGRDLDGSCAYDLFSADGSACSDDDVCTENDRCLGGTCRGELVNCGDSDPCTADSCSGATGCQHAPIEGCHTVLAATVARYEAHGSAQGRSFSCHLACTRRSVSSLFFEDAAHYRN